MKHPYCMRSRRTAHAQERRPKMADPSEVDLAAAKAAVGTLLEGLGLAAHLYAVEPRHGKWAIIVECATESGWQRTELRAGPELLAAIRGDSEARAGLLAQWRAYLDDCKAG